jgi:hypothetical protein
VVDLGTTIVNVAGLAAFVAGVIVTYLAAVWGARALVRTQWSLVPDFVLSLVPIAAAYLAAHYFSLFVINGQFIVPLAWDRFGRGWDVFGTADFAPNLAVVSPRDRVVLPDFRARRRACGRARDRCLRRSPRRPSLSIPAARAHGALYSRRLVVALAEVVAHGGFAGAAVESLVVLAVVALFVAVWLRERRAPRRYEASESLSDDERTSS